MPHGAISQSRRMSDVVPPFPVMGARAPSPSFGGPMDAPPYGPPPMSYGNEWAPGGQPMQGQQAPPQGYQAPPGFQAPPAFAQAPPVGQQQTQQPQQPLRQPSPHGPPHGADSPLFYQHPSQLQPAPAPQQQQPTMGGQQPAHAVRVPAVRAAAPAVGTAPQAPQAGYLTLQQQVKQQVEELAKRQSIPINDKYHGTPQKEQLQAVRDAAIAQHQAQDQAQRQSFGSEPQRAQTAAAQHLQAQRASAVALEQRMHQEKRTSEGAPAASRALNVAAGLSPAFQIVDSRSNKPDALHNRTPQAQIGRPSAQPATRDERAREAKRLELEATVRANRTPVTKPSPPRVPAASRAGHVPAETPGVTPPAAQPSAAAAHSSSPVASPGDASGISVVYRQQSPAPSPGANRNVMLLESPMPKSPIRAARTTPSAAPRTPPQATSGDPSVPPRTGSTSRRRSSSPFDRTRRARTPSTGAEGATRGPAIASPAAEALSQLTAAPVDGAAPAPYGSPVAPRAVTNLSKAATPTHGAVLSPGPGLKPLTVLLVEHSKLFVDMVNCKNWFRLADRYASQARLVSPEAEYTEGKQIVEFWKQSGFGSLRREPLHIFPDPTDEQTAYEGGWYMTESGQSGNYFVVWRRQLADRWKILVDLVHVGTGTGGP